jgi:tripartite-type tricarboxylate transporter receptor subunit TctC
MPKRHCLVFFEVYPSLSALITILKIRHKTETLMKLSAAAFALTSLYLTLLHPQVQAQPSAFPSKAVRFISPFPTGSGPDVVARMLAERLGIAWKQPVIVDTRPGANGFLAAPTGYELLLADVGHLAISPSLFKKLPYDPKADFIPIGGVYRTSFYVVVAADSPFKSLKDLIAAAAAEPGKITYGSNSIGGPLHLGAAQVEAATGTKMLHVPYKEISQLYLAVSTGEINWAMGSLASAGPLLKAGKVRLLAIADNARSSVMPIIPTFEEAGGPRGVSVRSWVALFAPKGTPTEVVATLNRSLNETLKMGDIVEKFAAFGFVPDFQTPSSLVSLIDSDTVFYADMVKRTGASVD